MSSWHDSVAVFDLETTGIDVTSARVVTAFVGVLDADGRVLESRTWLADPGVEIPAGAAAVHGITTERARAEGRPARAVVGEIVAALQEVLDRGLPLVVYNAPYDLTLLHHETARHDLAALAVPEAVVDPLVIDKAVDRYRKGKRTLTAAAEVYGVPLEGAHDAGADAVAAGRVAQALAQRYPEQLALPLAELHRAQRSWCDEANDSYERFRRRNDPSFVVERGWPLRGERVPHLDLPPAAADALF
ncbi:exonuclease domain-containing protein [Arenivirga flava]|nr:exonuclease domain-containing protein [Arenivirga flava]